MRDDWVGPGLHESRRVPRYLYNWIRSQGFRILDVGEPIQHDSLFLGGSGMFTGLYRQRDETFACDWKNWRVDKENAVGTPIQEDWCVNIAPGTMRPLDDGFSFLTAMRSLAKLNSQLQKMLDEDVLPTHAVRAGKLLDEFHLTAQLIRDSVDYLEAKVQDAVTKAILPEHQSVASSSASSSGQEPQPSPASPAPPEP